MKKMKKFISIILTAIMVLAMAMPAFAAGEGKITINEAVVGQTYSIYRIFDLESYNSDAGAYAYKTNTTWEAFAKSQADYVNVDSQGYVTWITGADAAEFAKKALAYAETNGISTLDSKEATSITVEFTGLDLGYYLVDSSLGALCSLNTTNTEATILEKNEAPTLSKKVEEDSKEGLENSFGEDNNADITQTVNFKTSITAQPGAENYVLHDKMDAGLVWDGSVVVTLDGESVTEDKYTLLAAPDNAPSDGCTFEIEFTDEFCNAISEEAEIVITYSATLADNAVVGGSGNKNEAWLTYGDNNATTKDTTVTYTYDLDVFKYTEKEVEVDGEKVTENVALAGAKFTLSKTINGDALKFTSEGENVYRYNPNGDVTEIETDDSGRFNIKGLDADTYYLTETEAPDGYNKLAEAKIIVIGDDGNFTVDGDSATEVGVLNSTGTILPSTGGIGTTVFYLAGIVVMAGAVFFVIRSRKRA